MHSSRHAFPPARLLPVDLRWRLRQAGCRPGPLLLTVSLNTQTMTLWKPAHPPSARPTAGGITGTWTPTQRYRISSSRFGIGQEEGSFCTPLGLHRIARKIGAGQPIGTVFKHRRVVGLTWEGLTEATICHRILWLEGLEPGFNQGGKVDTFARYIYIHGFADETTLGRPQSHGCLHMAATDLIPMFDRVREGTVVWIARN